MSDPIHWPDSLDPAGKGYTRRMALHLNFGEDGGAATFRIHDPEGRPLPITYQYDTRKPTAKVVPYRTGFAIDGFGPPDGGDRPVFARWADVVAVYPTALAERRAAAATRDGGRG